MTIQRLSPLPIVNLEDVNLPQDGLFVRLPPCCRKHFAESTACRDHYRSFSSASYPLHEYVQCPFGFSTYAFATAKSHFAFTALIPWPRLGGKKEANQAKRNPDNKLARSQVKENLQALLAAESSIASLVRHAIERNAMSLHEARKFNRAIKQSAERICRMQNPDNPHLADVDLVKIWKAADFMSTQFEILELIANEEITRLPVNTTINLYPLCDKVVRLYSTQRVGVTVNMDATPAGFRAPIDACDKTIHMIPTVLIENAIKYARTGTRVDVKIHQEGMKHCMLVVSNVPSMASTFGLEVFEKGVRASSLDGTGFGLYLAQLIANQHQTKIELECRLEKVTFFVRLHLSSEAD